MMNKPVFFNDVMVIWELRGNYPQNIPTFADVDIAELTKGDDDPMFLTLPIGKVNATSNNGRYYDEAWLQELERQTIANRPIGIMGHLREDELGTSFPPEAIHWVGVQRVGEMLWGKGYVPPGEARERVRRYKATNKQLATSIFAEARGAWDKAVNAVRMAADSLKLKQIDIGPADRVGIPSLATNPIITAEMSDANPTEDKTMDKLQVINEMTPDDARLLPDPVRNAILATIQEPAEVKTVKELRAALGVDDKADLGKLISEMKAATEQQQAAAVSNRIRELIEHEETGVKLKPARPIITELVNARRPATAQEAETAYKEVVGSDHVKSLLTEMLKATAGPKHGAPATNANGTGTGEAVYFPLPEGENS